MKLFQVVAALIFFTSTSVFVQRTSGIGSFCNEQLVDDLGVLCSDGKTAPDANGCCFKTDGSPTCPANCAGGSFSGGAGNWQCSCRSCQSTTSFKLDMTTDQRWLAAHNYFRCRHGVDLLETKASAVTTASNYASKCVFEHSQSNERDGAGENLAMGYRSPESATEAWYNEITDPGYAPGSGFSSGTGHYTALIWKSTRKLGCATCASKRIDVCHYADSTPNVQGQFILNVPQSNVPTATAATCCAAAYSAYSPCSGSAGVDSSCGSIGGANSGSGGANNSSGGGSAGIVVGCVVVGFMGSALLATACMNGTGNEDPASLPSTTMTAHTGGAADRGSSMSLSTSVSSFFNSLMPSMQSTLPPGWTELYDKSSGRAYYFNERSNCTQWEKPT